MRDKRKTIIESTHRTFHARLILPTSVETLIHLRPSDMTSGHLRLAAAPSSRRPRRRHGRSIKDGDQDENEQKDAHTHHELHILFTLNSNAFIVFRECRACELEHACCSERGGRSKGDQEKHLPALLLLLLRLLLLLLLHGCGSSMAFVLLTWLSSSSCWFVRGAGLGKGRVHLPLFEPPSQQSDVVLFGTNLTRLLRRTQLAHCCPSDLLLRTSPQLHHALVMPMQLLPSLAFACMRFSHCLKHTRDASKHGWIHGPASHGFTSSHRFPPTRSQSNNI